MLQCCAPRPHADSRASLLWRAFSAHLLDLPTLTSLLPTPTGELTEDHIVGEIGELLNGDVQGRQDEEEVTLFKSLGCALEDLTAAAAVHAKATEAAPRL